MSIHTDPHQDQTLWSRYIDGDLQSEQSTALENHLKTCPKCRKEVQMLRQTIDWIGQLRQLEAPNDFPAQVRQRIRRQRQAKRRRLEVFQKTPSGISWMPAFLVAIIIALSILIYMFGTALPPAKRSAKSSLPPAKSSFARKAPKRGLIRLVPVRAPAKPTAPGSPAGKAPSKDDAKAASPKDAKAPKARP